MSRKRTKRLDLEAAARSLFNAAVARHDFTGATSVLRLLKDLEKAPAPDRSSQMESEAIVAEATDAEREELRRLIDRVSEIKQGVLARIVGTAPATVPLVPVDEPPPAPAEEPRARGVGASARVIDGLIAPGDHSLGDKVRRSPEAD